MERAGHKGLGLQLGPSLEAEDRIFTAFNAVEMGHLQRLLQSGDGRGGQYGQTSLLLPAKRTWRSEPAPASSAEELAEITKSRIRRDTGDNGDKLSSDGLIVAHSSAASGAVQVGLDPAGLQERSREPRLLLPGFPVPSGTAEHKQQVGEPPTVASPVSPAFLSSFPSPIPVCRVPSRCC